MKNYLFYNGKKSSRLTINIDPEVDFREILDILNSISFPEFITNIDNIQYAILELINNSIRAHKEKRISEKKITTSFVIEDKRLNIAIKDFGGGFDPKKLPYNLNDNCENIDHTGHEFQEYQKSHNNLRFGMGLLLAKKTFPYFEIIFFDKQSRPLDWEPGNVYGTLINLSTGDDNEYGKP